MKELNAHELKALLDSGKKVAILDVREPEELVISSIENTLNIPLMQLPELLQRWADWSTDADFRVVICRVGGRSAQAVEYLNSMLNMEHYNLAGGINSYSREVDSRLQEY